MLFCKLLSKLETTPWKSPQVKFLKQYLLLCILNNALQSIHKGRVNSYLIFGYDNFICTKRV